MGALRLFLAINVVSEHSGPILGVGAMPGFLAVELFYVISGFYMGLILTEKYQHPGGWKIFYINRALRLLPIYYFVLALTLLLCLYAALQGRALPAYIAGYAQAGRFSTTTLAVVTLPNLSLFGLDVLHFFHITPEGGLAPSLQPPTALFDPNAAGRWFSFIPQAWTLGLELEFYLVAPLLVRWRSRRLLLLFAASAAARGLFYHWGYTADPWSDRFFPFEIALFVGGLLAYRGYRWLTQAATAQRVKPMAPIGRLGIVGVVATFVVFANVPRSADFAAVGHGLAANWLLIAGVTIVLPWIFAATRRSRIDNWIGQYSYPIYISHFVFIGFFGDRLRLFGEGYGLSVVLLSIGLSGLLLYASRGVERRRERSAALAMQA